VFDRPGLLWLFRYLAGRRLIGAVDGFECVELVFEYDEDHAGNLVSIFTDGPRRGLVAFGGGYADGQLPAEAEPMPYPTSSSSNGSGGAALPPMKIVTLEEFASDHTEPCARCAGTGRYGHLGVCFACEGTGEE
jgi:hypothetical protein